MYVIDGEITDNEAEYVKAVLKELHDLHRQSIQKRGKYASTNKEVFEFMWSTEKELENAISLIEKYLSSIDSDIKRA